MFFQRYILTENFRYTQKLFFLAMASEFALNSETFRKKLTF